MRLRVSAAAVVAVLFFTAPAPARPILPPDPLRQAPPWLAEIAAALTTDALRVVSVERGEAYYWPLLSRPFFPTRCPGVELTDPWTLMVDVRFETKRTYRMAVLVGQLPKNGDAYAPLLAAAKDQHCDLPKSGLSLLQIGTSWLAFPGVCGDSYAYRHSLPVVVAALHARFGARLPEGFILGGCGIERLTSLTSVAGFAPSVAPARKRP